jgi:zinc transport system substrate-binding protein
VSGIPSSSRYRASVRLGGAAILASLALSLSPAAATDLKVVATIKPIHALVAQVMEGVGTPSLLVQGAASPHSYALKPSDARALNNADVFFRVSETVEPFTRKITASLPDTVRTVTLADAPGIELLDIRTGNTFERHDHAHEHAEGEGEEGHEHADHDHDHEAGHDGHAHDDHAADDAHDDHAHPARDGHVWLDPANARKMVTEIARVLSEKDPAHAAMFAANAARANDKLEALEADVARDLAPLKGKPYVVFHDAYQYFERRFDLAAVGSITLSPEAQPSAKRLTEIRQKLTGLSAACVFAEPQFKPNLVAAVTEGTSARAGTLDPEGALLDPGPGAYETLIRHIAAGLKSCLIAGS